MNIRDRFTLKLFCLLPLLAFSNAYATAIFDPDWVDPVKYSTQPVGYVGAPVASGYVLNNVKSVFTIDYSSLNWGGNLHSYEISTNGTVSATDSWVIPASGTVAAKYGAAPQIDLQNYDTGRNIVTMNGATPIAFRWSNLSSTQKSALDSATSATATTSPLLDYVRGQRSNEAPNGNNYRARASVVGDIIHSTPLYWDDGSLNTTVTPSVSIGQTVFVGANDGMLHAINATTGAERFAYIPSVLIPKLNVLKTSPYAHKYFVDGQLAARKFTFTSGTTTTSKSILAGGLGGGGKGLFALDITAVPTTETAAKSKILWEITNSSINSTDSAANAPTSSAYANLGHTYGTPVLATLPIGTTGTNALIVANGYNNTGNYHAVLYIINPLTGAKLGEMDTGSGSSANPNGLSSPTVVDDNFDGKMDYAYAGDLNGNLWKFDLSDLTSTPIRLYTTATSPAQSITMAPGFKAHPYGGYMITFVTGRNFIAADETNTAIHYAYGIWDKTTTVSATPSATAAAYPVAESTLLTQALTESNYTSGATTIRVRTASNNQPHWPAVVASDPTGTIQNMGWKTPLVTGTTLAPTSLGERVVGDGAFVTGSTFLFLTSNPTINPNATPPGENWWMQLNALTGGDNGAVKFDLNADGKFTVADQVTVSAVTMSPVGRYMGGGVRSQLTAFSTSGFDIYLANYDKNGDPTIPVTTSTAVGVAGGHFDEDIYYNFINQCPTIAGAYASGSVTFTYSSPSTSAKNVTALTISVNGETIYSGAPGSIAPKALDDLLDGMSSANYKITKNFGDDHTIKITALNSGSTWNRTITVTMTVTGVTSPNFTKVDLAGGVTGSIGPGTTNACNTMKHVHEYDDIYDRTGVNMLDASEKQFNLSKAIPSTTTEFKVIASNQYLSPAVSIHFNGTPSYVYNVNAGYIPIKNFITSATLDVTDNTKVPTYTRATVNSLAINMPVDAFVQKDWWGGALGLPADTRVGLHPVGDHTCVWGSAGKNDGNMYQPVNPPLSVTASGQGTLGYNSGTTSLTATGVRHNGALTIQVIAANTPNSAIELSVPNHPEYGWRVKSDYYGTYVLAEYTTFWHTKIYDSKGQSIAGPCYGESGWTKAGYTDTRTCGTKDTLTTRVCATLDAATAAAASDPKIGAFGTGGPAVGTTSSTVTEANGTTTTTTITVALNTSGGTTTTTTVTNSGGGSTTTTKTDDIDIGGAVDSSGIIGGGVTTPLEALGRVNWRELFK